MEPPLRNINTNIDDDDEGSNLEEIIASTSKICGMLQRDDPELEELCVGSNPYNIIPHPDDWARFGVCISRSKNIKCFELGYADDTGNHNIPTLENYRVLFKHMEGNKSIYDLVIRDLAHSGRELPALVPFLKSNSNLHSIRLGTGGGEINLEEEETGHFLAEALKSFSTLRKFECCGWGTPPNASLKIVQALSGHKQLQDLELDHVLQDHTKSYEALVLLFQSCRMLNKFTLNGDAIGDEGAVVMAVGIGTWAKQLMTLKLSGSEIGQTGWLAVSTLFMNKETKLEVVSIPGSWFAGRKPISTCSLTSIANNLAHSNKIKKLDLSNQQCIGLEGWKSLFDYIATSDCVLEELEITRTNLSNERINLLLQSLQSNSSLSSLDISYNESLSIEGLRGFGDVFQSQCSVLEFISIDSIDDNIATLFSGFLARSGCKLKKIFSSYSGVEDEKLTSAGCKAIATSLCSEESIMATYNSNHVFEQLAHFGVDFPELEYSLSLNEEFVSSYCARLKIFKVHFTSGREETNLMPFYDMQMEVLPHAISWIGDACDACGLNAGNTKMRKDMIDSATLMYQLVRSMPTLFEADVKMKRKRSSQRKVSDYFMPAVRRE